MTEIITVSQGWSHIALYAALGHDNALYRAWWTTERVTAAVTALTFVAIAWQALETRRAVQDQTLLQKEAVKARLEQRGPNVAVTVTSVEQVVFRPGTQAGQAEPIPSGTTYQEGEADDQILMVRAWLKISNDGDSTVHVAWQKPLMPDGDAFWLARQGVIQHAELAPGGPPLVLWLAGGHSVAAWRRNFGKRAGPEFLEQLPTKVEAQLLVKDLFDEGIDETWHLSVGGEVVSHVRNARGLWAVLNALPDQTLSARAVAGPRVYWLSRRDSRRM